MARSFYKGEPLGKLPPCAICVGRGEGPRARLHLPGGVSVWLCAAHRSPEFLRRRAGRDFFASLSAVWEAGGRITARQRQALEMHVARVVAPPAVVPRPGSYSWPDLRREAELLWAGGAPAGPVIDRLRARESRGSARPPSRPTMYRWFREGRWLAEGPSPVVRTLGDG